MNAILMSKIDDLTKAVTDLPNALLEALKGFCWESPV